MDLMILALIGSAAFVLVILITAFIRQFMLRHDTLSNNKAQSSSLIQEVAELEKIRMQMQSNKRYEIHYQVLGANKETISKLDLRIEEILAKKGELVDHYVQVTLKESGFILQEGQASSERKADCDKFKETIGEKIAYYDNELKQMQERRATLWNTHIEYQKLLLAQEKARNASLDSLYGQHSAVLEAIYIRHIDHTVTVSVKNTEASTLSFKDLLLAPIQFLMQVFGMGGRGPGGIILPNFTFVQTREESLPRPAQGPTWRPRK